MHARRLFVLIAGACWGAAGCGGPPAHVPDEVTRYPQDYRAAEATSLLGRRLYAQPPGSDVARLEADLADARASLDADPSDPAKCVWVGRRLGYLWRMTDAIKEYTRGIEAHPNDAPLYRHRGHRYLAVRQFDRAVRDLETASRLMEGRAGEIEPDGIPNKANQPLTTLGFNVWYHLGIAHYLQGDFAQARAAFEETMKHLGGHDDNLVAATDWLYMTLRRMGKEKQAAKLLEPIDIDLHIVENFPYHQRLLMYKRILAPEELLGQARRSDLDMATLGYGVGNWYLYNGDPGRAAEVFEKIVAGPYWPAFGYLAAEADLARMRGEKQ